MATTNGEAWADAGPPSLLDPGAFECPCGPCEYDCQKRAPVRSACACKRLLCRKCAGVAASLPDPAPCGLCGAEAVGPFEAGEFVLDAGVLLALMGRLEAREPYVGGELADAQCCIVRSLVAVNFRCCMRRESRTWVASSLMRSAALCDPSLLSTSVDVSWHWLLQAPLRGLQ